MDDKSRDVVQKWLYLLLGDLIADERGEDPLTVALSKELGNALIAVAIKSIRERLKKEGELTGDPTLDEGTSVQLAVFHLAFNLGFSLGSKKNPYSYADDFVRKGARKEGVDFQAVAEWVQKSDGG